MLNCRLWASFALAILVFASPRATSQLRADEPTLETASSSRASTDLAKQLAAARDLDHAEQWDAALALYERIFATGGHGPECPAAMLAAARLHAKLHHRREALALYERLSTEYPRLHERDVVLYEWAWLLSEEQRPEAAEALFAQLCRDYPESGLAADSMYRLALAAWERREVEEADRRLAGVSLARLPSANVPQALMLSAKIALELRDWAAAEARLQRLRAEYAGHPAARAAGYWLAETAFRAGAYSQAAAQLRRQLAEPAALPQELQSVAELRFAQSLGQLDRWDESLAAAQRIVDSSPTTNLRCEAEYVRGRALASMGEYAAARAAFQQAIENETTSTRKTVAMARWMVGETYFHEDDLEQAIAAYERLFEQTPSLANPWQAAALLQTGKCLERQGRSRSAMDLYERIEREFADTPYVAEARQRRELAAHRLAAPSVAARAENSGR